MVHESWKYEPRTVLLFCNIRWNRTFRSLLLQAMYFKMKDTLSLDSRKLIWLLTACRLYRVAQLYPFWASLAAFQTLFFGKSVGKKDDMNYVQVRGHVPKAVAQQFKQFCLDKEINYSEGLEQILTIFFATHERQSRNDSSHLLNSTTRTSGD